MADFLEETQSGKPEHFQTTTNVSRVRASRLTELQKNQTVGFVPTMGALHDGHLALIRQAAKENHRVYVSIYVNPTQFGVAEDFDSYPKAMIADSRMLSALFQEFKSSYYMGQLSQVFRPSTQDMYPGLPPTSEIDGEGSFVTINPISKVLEGASRPVFFRGVATVCMKLLNIVQPDRVYFGQKDIQQTLVIKRMVEDFHLNTKVRVGPTIRETDGLAMSSRNVYLGQRRREVAPVLILALQAVQQAFADGRRTRADLLEAAFRVTSAMMDQQRELPASQRANFEVDYFSIADPKMMTELDEVSAEQGAIVSGAIRMLPVEDPQVSENLGLGDGKTTVRLIDNIELDILTSKLGVF
ncbi:pantothenate synthase [Pseudocyphellaria aurata]|nr:pantothenate synthase [Pseudocyphellaria aurata]